jgi:hypothetical protein
MTTLADYRVPASEYPKILYRVDHAQACTRFHGVLGFLATRPNYELKDQEDFEIAVQRHLWWDHGFESPFISLFSDEDHAWNWGHKWKKNNSFQDFKVVKIEIKATHDVVLFSVPLLLARLDITPKNHAYHNHEYLCLHNIPLICITSVRGCEIFHFISIESIELNYGLFDTYTR